MFLKLIKTDFKYYVRHFMCIFIGILLASIFIISSESLQVNVNNRNLEAVNYVLFIMSECFLMISCIWSISIIIKIFYNKCISAESYLTFSLPVKKYQVVLSNTLWSLIMMFTVLILVCLSQTLKYHLSFNTDKLSRVMKFIYEHKLLIINCVIQCISILFLMYFSVVLANVTILKKYHRLLGVTVFLVILYWEYKVSSWLLNLVYNYFNLDCLVYGSVCFEIISLIIWSIYCMFFYFGILYLMDKRLEID